MIFQTAQTARKYLSLAIFSIAATAATPAAAGLGDLLGFGKSNDKEVSSSSARTGYAAAFSAIRSERWDDARNAIAGLPRDRMRALATAELYLAKNSPVVEAYELETLLNEAPWLPQGQQLARLAAKRGVTNLPALPHEQNFSWLGSAPYRSSPDWTSDPAASELRTQINDRIKNDDPAGAEALLNAAGNTLRSDSLSEMQKRVAWSYYIENDDIAALRMARLAMAGQGEWAAQGQWVFALTSWRIGDYEQAYRSFADLSTKAREPEFKSAAYYWAGRSAMAAGHPERVQPMFQAASRDSETLYGILAGEALGIEPVARRALLDTKDQAKRIASDDGIELVRALVAIGETPLADETLKFFARTGRADEHAKYLAAAREIGLPQAQLWLAHNGPAGTHPDSFARYPSPNWQPDGGWRIDRALVYAHALQESRFRADAISPAGARGLLQLMPGTAQQLARSRGMNVSTEDLHRPDLNLEFGQTYMEMMRDRGETAGLLPKVIAAYNAGPTPVGRWAYEVRDNGDPLLFMESIPYWETRGYVATVMRNYWMYEAQEKPDSDSRAGLAQNMWPRYPGLSGPKAVRLNDPKAQDRIANR